MRDGELAGPQRREAEAAAPVVRPAVGKQTLIGGEAAVGHARAASGAVTLLDGVAAGTAALPALAPEDNYAIAPGGRVARVRRDWLRELYTDRYMVLLFAMQLAGAIPWATPQRIVGFAKHRAPPDAAGPDVLTFAIDLTVVADLGVPAEHAQVARVGARRLAMVLGLAGTPSLPDAEPRGHRVTIADDERGKDLTAAFAALETFTGLRAKQRGGLEAIMATADSAYVPLGEDVLALIFGEHEWTAWLAARDGKQHAVARVAAVAAPVAAAPVAGAPVTVAPMAAAPVAAAPMAAAPMAAAPMAAAPREPALLTPAELARVARWFEAGELPLPSRPDLELLRLVMVLEADPALAAEALQLMHAGHHAAAAVDTFALRALLEQAQLVLERKRLGLAADNHVVAVAADGRTPHFEPEMKLARQGMLLPGQPIHFEIALDWSKADTLAPAARHAVLERRRVAKVDWVFERTDGAAASASGRVLGASHDYDLADRAIELEHAFQLGGSERGTWTVHAFVSSNWGPPKHLAVELEIATERAQMEQLRAEAFAGMTPAGAQLTRHQFKPRLRDMLTKVAEYYALPGVLNLEQRGESHDLLALLANDGDYVGGALRGALPEGFAPVSPEVRAQQRKTQFQQTQALLDLLADENAAAGDGTYDTALAAATRHRDHLIETGGALQHDRDDDRKSFELRGTYFSRQAEALTGPLELYGSSKALPDGTVNVQIRDLSKRFDAQDMTFTAARETFAEALEAAFVDLCKAYPEGKLAILAQELNPHTLAATGQAIGFDLPTTSTFKRGKAFAESDAVGVVETGLMLFAPEVAMPLAFAKDIVLGAEELVSKYDNGTLTWGDGAILGLRLAVDGLPVFKQAKRAGKSAELVTVKAARLGQAVNMAEATLVMGVSVHAAIVRMQEDAIPALAAEYAQVHALYAAHPTDPNIAKRKADVLARAASLREETAKIWIEASAKHVAFLVGMHRLSAAAQKVRGAIGERLAPAGESEQVAPDRANAVRAAEAANREVDQAGARWANLVGEAKYVVEGEFRLALASGELEVRVVPALPGGEVRVRQGEGFLVLEVPVGKSAEELERIVVSKLTELRHAEMARVRAKGGKPAAAAAKSDLGEEGAGRALTPQDLGKVAELRVLRMRHAQQVARGDLGSEQAKRLGAEIGTLEASLGLVGDSEGAVARRHAVDVQTEIQNDAARRQRVREELDGEHGHPGIELHSHFFGVVDAEVFRQRAVAAKGGDPKSWRQLLETIAGFERPSFKHETVGPRITKRAAAGDAIKIARDAQAQVEVLLARAKGTDDEAEKAAFLRGADAVAEEACDVALRATPETDFNSAYEIRDELVKQTFGGPAVPGENAAQREQRAYDDFIRETILKLSKSGTGYSEQSVSVKKLAGKVSPERIAAVIDKLVADGELAPGEVDVRMLGMTHTRHFGERGESLPDVPAPAELDDDGFAQEKKQLVDQLANKGTAGKDIGGPEHFDLSAKGKARLREIYLEYLAYATRTGQPAVFRPHVGEGAVDNEGDKPFATDANRHVGADGNPSHYERAHRNIEMTLEVMEELKAEGLYDPTKVIVRFGHATHADPMQAARMQGLDIIAEVNLGSNVATGSLSPTDAQGKARALEQQLNDHAFSTLIYCDTPIALSTDAGAVMGTTLAAEYDSAFALIDSVLAGNARVRVSADDARIVGTDELRGVAVPGYPELRELSIYDMTPEERTRFRNGYEKLYKDAADYYRRRPKPHGVAGDPIAPSDASPLGGTHHVDLAVESGLIASHGLRLYEGVRADVDVAAVKYRRAGYRVDVADMAGGVVLATVTSPDAMFTLELRSWPGGGPEYLPFDPRAASDATLTPSAARDWYNEQVRRIAVLDAGWLNEAISLEERARRCFAVRHHARLATREQQPRNEVAGLEFRDTNKYGDIDGPSFDALFDAHVAKGLTPDEAYQKIITSSQKTDEGYNARASAGKSTP